MGASTTDFNYRVALVPSRRAVAFVLLSAAATTVLAIALPLDPVYRMAIVAWLGILTLSAQRKARAASELQLDAARIEVTRFGQPPQIGCLADGCFVAPWLTVIRWRPDGARFDRTIAVLPDMLSREDFRRLRVLLKTGDRSLVPRSGTLGTDHPN